MSDQGDENVNSLNIEQGGGSGSGSDGGATASVVLTKTPRKAATSSRITTGKATPGAPSTPATGARSRTATAASLLSTLPAKAKVGVLSKQAEGAARVNVNNWSQQDVFTVSMEEVLEACATTAATAAETAPLLDECMGTLIAALATCTNCNHSATQTRALKCFRLLFEQAASFKRIDAHLDVALPALLNMVGHNSAAFLRSEGEAMLLCAMRHVNAGRVTYTVARELLSDKHDKNTPKMTALAALAADGMDHLTVGYFPGQKESAPQAPVALQDLPKNYYKDLIRCVSRLNAMPHQPFRAAAARMARGLVEKGQANFTLTAMLRDLARTDKRAARDFEALAKELTGKELPSHTTAASAAAQAPALFSPGSARTRARSASTAAGGVLATCASPLPPSAAKGSKVYANTMPKEMGSPLPVVAASASASDAALSHQSHPLPASSSSGDEHADYQTAGAGLLDNVSESLCFNYSPTAGGRASAGAGAGAGAGADGSADAPVERQLFAATGRADGSDALGLSVLDDDDNIVILNPRSSTAAGSAVASGASASASSAGLNDSLDVSSGMVYNYNRGSMAMDGASATRSSMAATASALAASSAPVSVSVSVSSGGPASNTRRQSSGQKRKASGGDLQESELCSTADSALSPGGKLRKIGALTAQLKRARHEPSAAASASASQTLAAAMRLVGDVQASHMARVDAQNKEQQAFWTNMRHNLRSKRNKQQA